MADPVQGILEVQTDPGGVTTIVLDPDSAKVVVGANGEAGAVIIVDGAERQRIGLDGGQGDIVATDANENRILHFDGASAALYVGGEDHEGDVIVRDRGEGERIKLDGGRGDISVDDEKGNRLLFFLGASAALYVGGINNEGDVIVRDDGERERVRLDGGRGDIVVQDPNGNDILHFDGASAGLYVGGLRKEGDVIVRDQSARERIKLDGGQGDIVVRDGLSRERIKLDGSLGDISVNDDLGNNLLHFDSEFAALYVGGSGSEGDVIVRDGTGTETIKLDGGRGDIILSNADCAEEFDVAGDVSPGSVMVIGDDERLTLSSAPYDRRVAGVVSGAGAYRPGIVLGRRPDAVERPAIALAGRVHCRVDASHGAIRVGDLLVSSSTPGHAMRAADSSRWPGAVLGKALRALPDGKGLVPILVTLQ